MLFNYYNTRLNYFVKTIDLLLFNDLINHVTLMLFDRFTFIVYNSLPIHGCIIKAN